MEGEETPETPAEGGDEAPADAPADDAPAAEE